MASMPLPVAPSVGISGYKIFSRDSLENPNTDLKCIRCFRQVLKLSFKNKVQNHHLHMECLRNRIRKSALRLRSQVQKLLPKQELLPERLQEKIKEARVTINAIMANEVLIHFRPLLFGDEYRAEGINILRTATALSKIENKFIPKIKEFLEDKADPSEKQEEGSSEDRIRFLEIEDQLMIANRIQFKVGKDEIQQGIYKLLEAIVRVEKEHDFKCFVGPTSEILLNILNSQDTPIEKVKQIKEKMDEIVGELEEKPESQEAIERLKNFTQDIEYLLGVRKKEDLLQEREILLEQFSGLQRYTITPIESRQLNMI